MEMPSIPPSLSSTTSLRRERATGAEEGTARASAAREAAAGGAAAAAPHAPLPDAPREVGGHPLWVDVDLHPPTACASSSTSPLDWHAAATHSHVSPAGDSSEESTCGCVTRVPHSASLDEPSPRRLPCEGEVDPPKQPSTSMPSTPLESHVAASNSNPRRSRRSRAQSSHSSHSSSVGLPSSRDEECCTRLGHSLDRVAGPCLEGKQCHVAFTVPAEFNRPECQDGCLRCLVLQLSEEEWREKRQAALGTRQGSGNLHVMVEHLETKLRNL